MVETPKFFLQWLFGCEVLMRDVSTDFISSTPPIKQGEEIVGR